MVIDEGIRLLTEQMILFAVVDKWAGGGKDGVAMRTQLNLQHWQSVLFAVGSLYWQTQTSQATPLPSHGYELLDSSQGRKVPPLSFMHVLRMHARTHTHKHTHT